MSISKQLERLDELIVERTTPPAQAELRNKVATIREQVEAMEQRIADLEKENCKLVAEDGKLQAQLHESKVELEKRKLEDGAGFSGSGGWQDHSPNLGG